MSANSNQWEVVTKSKKAKNLEKKVEARTEQKRLDKLQPKLEEILPSHQYHKLISGKNAGKGNESPTKSTGSSTKSKSPKKTTKNNNNNNNAPIKEQETKKQQAKGPAKPKNLETALRNITVDNFLSQLEQLKLTFPGSELLWLKGVAAYFNSNLPFDCDPVFSGKSPSYPSNLATQSLKNVVVHFMEGVGEANLAYFYHTLLTSMAMELSKNMPVVGYKFLLQLMAQNWPRICSNNMAKTALLRNSYQNRSNVCLTILWAIGQGGYQQLMEGIKIWQNLMLPCLELKSYSKFVVEYIERVLNVAVDQSLNMNQQEFFTTYNVLRNSLGLPRDLQESLQRSSELFLQKFIASTSKHANLFLTLLRDIEHGNKSRVELEGCIRCLSMGEDSYKVWKMNYKKQLLPTTLLLQKITIEWEHRGKALTEANSFDNFLTEASILNAELAAAKRVDPYLNDLIKAVESAQEKSSAAQQQKKKQNSESKKKCGCCKWALSSLFLVFLIGGVLAYDTQVNGKGVFAKSATGKVLANAGLLPYVEKTWYVTMSASARGYKWAEKHVPPYAKPVGKLGCDLWKFTRNTACNVFTATRDFLSVKLPVAGKFLDQYVPGLSKKIETASVTVKNIVVDVFAKTVTIVKTQILVGRLSPENLSKALNQTQNLALEYYNVFHKKVDAYAKLK